MATKSKSQKVLLLKPFFLLWNGTKDYRLQFPSITQLKFFDWLFHIIFKGSSRHLDNS